tara:strand:+ start:173 stop:802 length:630 start_codon:yes stop_codon:yes gene_type:complete
MPGKNFLESLMTDMGPKAHDAINQAIDNNDRMKFQEGGMVGNIVSLLQSLFKKDSEDSVGPGPGLPLDTQSDELKVARALQEIERIDTSVPGTRYGMLERGPENIFGDDIEMLAKILYDIEGGQEPGRYSFSGKGKYDNPNDPQKLIGMVADVFTEPKPRMDIFGRPQLTGKSFGTADVQDIVKLISQDGLEESAVLDTILQQIQPMTK